MAQKYMAATTKMHAYVIMLHLRSKGWTNFAEIWKLLSWDGPKNHYVSNSCLAYIDTTIRTLQKEWNEDIPRINAFVFTGKTECTDSICKNIFGNKDGSQPSEKQIAEYAAKIAAYPKWDQVIEFLRNEAFNTAGSKGI